MADLYTPAEHDAVCGALHGRLRDQPGVPESVSLMYAADAVLDAAAPLIAARVRRQVAKEIAQAIEDAPPEHCGCGCGCAAVARRHATPPTEEDADAN